MRTINIDTDFIKLDQLLKLADIAMTGGEAKIIVAGGEVKVNGEICTQRGKKIKDSDVVSYGSEEILVKTFNDK